MLFCVNLQKFTIKKEANTKKFKAFVVLLL